MCVIFLVKEVSMPNTEYVASGFDGIPCSDCGVKKGDRFGTHGVHRGARWRTTSEKAVPKGTTGCFCENCADARLKDHEAGRPVRPLGVMVAA